MKSNIENELTNIEHAYKELNIEKQDQIEFSLPYEESKRTLICYVKKDTTKNKYPRRFSIIKQKPL